jgi:hypothetical protein
MFCVVGLYVESPVALTTVNFVYRYVHRCVHLGATIERETVDNGTYFTGNFKTGVKCPFNVWKNIPSDFWFRRGYLYPVYYKEIVGHSCMT